jgi:Holliday junction resolvasome RuvABC DNA-binding subunit
MEPAAAEPVAALREDAILALVSLGMQRHAAQRVLERIDWKRPEMSDLEAVIKEALKHAGGL